MERKDIDQRLKWDTTSIYAKDEDFYEDIENIKKLADKLVGFKGKITASLDNFKEFIKLDEEFSRKLEKACVYASLKSDEDTRVTKYQEMDQVATNTYVALTEALSFVRPELLATDQEKIKEYLKDPEIAHLSHYFEDIARYKDHTLDEKSEQIIASFGKTAQNPSATYMIFSNADMSFPSVEKDGEEIEITDANFVNLQQDKDRDFRRKVYEEYYKTYRQFSNTLASTLDGDFSAHNTEAKLRGFSSAREMSLFANNLPEEIYDNLLEVVHDNVDIHRDYTTLRKEFLGVDDLGFHDIYMPLVKDYDRKIEFDEAKEIVLEAIKPLGEEYVEVAKKGFETGWFDVCPNKGKRGGAYSSGSYDTQPFILLNYTNTIDDVFTVIHELGHSMHSYYTRSNQEYQYGSYSIFLAEIASTTNELLLLDYMLKNSKSEEETAYLLNYFVNQFKSTVFRQTMFAEFEHKVNKLVEAGEPIPAERLHGIYKELNEDLFGKDIEVDEFISAEWARIPHFYMFYYVFQYATGFMSAVALSQKILHGTDEDRAAYLDYLKAGESEYPLEVLKKAGVDMTGKDAMQKAMDVARDALKDLREAIL
ncbi:Oligoendopeptidase F, plasmid [Anaerococcus prevotii]|uniref:Oligopeptidase F n=1 Tax=Anaerococcus prevotii (strain ATCC 9321 / DSM 20548 / JCM 6508 / NCTC 11806 / PC1) TaxID=525919 RepID=C7RF52_ANAPD|nr:oligoendopeptidase F [Anaerococcus prevotii]ACV28113.1 oligoendopeptidase F [Anaerococcus prevotii DSM 20548]SUU93662.1 Oligoendopeptidase F, plasmid [Anaerococcus prevotii]